MKKIHPNERYGSPDNDYYCCQFSLEIEIGPSETNSQMNKHRNEETLNYYGYGI